AGAAGAAGAAEGAIAGAGGAAGIAAIVSAALPLLAVGAVATVAVVAAKALNIGSINQENRLTGTPGTGKTVAPFLGGATGGAANGVSSQVAGERAADARARETNSYLASIQRGIESHAGDGALVDNAIGRQTALMRALGRGAIAEVGKLRSIPEELRKEAAYRRAHDPQRADFFKMVAAIGRGAKSSDVLKLAKEFSEQKFGNIRAGDKILASLKALYAKTPHDSKLGRQLADAIRGVKDRLPGLAFQNKQLATAQRILDSGKSNDRKLARLQAIQQRLLDRGDTHAAAVIAKAIRDKKLSTVVNTHVTTNVSTYVSATQIRNAVHQAAAYGQRATAA
ncbi:MAG TPA: hypothetical protein VFS32_15065, partial [Candidatus Limnocylindrales bacterium]|nr:hypothetical protein [Candidatus Limnocylindrales bacterium]